MRLALQAGSVRAAADVMKSHPLVATITGWLDHRLVRALRRRLWSPFALLTIIGLVGSVWMLATYGWHPLVAPPVTATGLFTWRWLAAQSFDRFVRLPLRSRLRARRIYQRRWIVAMESAGLRSAVDKHTIPRRGRVRCTDTVDRVQVGLLPGQTAEDFVGVADRLAQTFGALDCRIYNVQRRPHEIELWLLITEPLEEVVEPIPTTVDDLARGLPVARAEDGELHRLHVIGSHVLVVGATGAGKGSVIWSLLVGLQPAIAAELVRVWAIDPKGGMELSLGSGLFDRFCHGDSAGDSYEESFAEVLEDAVSVMRQRQDRLRGVTRLHEPSVSEPLIMIIIDELAALTGWVNDRTVKRRIEAALGLLLSQGRAVGVVIVGAVQDPRKDVVPMRDLFPTRIALRVNEAEQVALVLGHGARARGAVADRIPERLPGVGYVVVDGVAEPRRVRFAYVSDEAIAAASTDPVPVEDISLPYVEAEEEAA